VGEELIPIVFTDAFLLPAEDNTGAIEIAYLAEQRKRDRALDYATKLGYGLKIHKYEDHVNYFASNAVSISEVDELLFGGQ
jgi:hypothetical protein